MKYLVMLGLITLAHAAATHAQDGAATPLIDHVPVNELPAEAAVELRFQTAAPDRMGVVTVHVLPDAHHAQSLAIPVRRTAQGYFATLPAERVREPALRYYVTQTLDGGAEQAVFASADAPHRVRVVMSPERAAELAKLRSKRSAIALQAEAVSFGAHKLTPESPELADRYYWLEAGYSYAVLSVVEEVALHLIRVRAEVGERVGTSAQLTQPGIDAGRATITWRLAAPLRVRSSLLLGASQRGFEYGGGMDVVLGDPRHVSLELGAHVVRTLGETAHLRLGFHALPQLPMGAAIEVTSFPSSHEPGVRLLYDVGYRFAETLEIALRAGYQGRSSITGGPSLGLAVRYGF